MLIISIVPDWKKLGTRLVDPNPGVKIGDFMANKTNVIGGLATFKIAFRATLQLGLQSRYSANGPIQLNRWVY